MRSRSLRFVASTLALGMAALSLGACTKDKGSDSTTAAAEAATTTATAETLPIAPASTDTTAAAAAAGETTAAPTTTAAAAAAAASATDTVAGPEPQHRLHGGRRWFLPDRWRSCSRTPT